MDSNRHPSAEVTPREDGKVRQIPDRAEAEPAREHIRNVLTILQAAESVDRHGLYFALDRDDYSAIMRRLTLALRQLEKPVVLLTRDLAGYLADVAGGIEPQDRLAATLTADDQIREDVAAVCGLLQAAKAGHITPTEAIDAALVRFLPEGAL